MDTNLRVILLVALSLAASFVIAAVPLLSPVWVLLTIWVSHRLLLTPGKAKRDGGGHQDANFWRNAAIGVVTASVLILGVWLVLFYNTASVMVGSSFTSIQYEFPPEMTPQPMPEFTREVIAEPMSEAIRPLFELTLTAQP
ncbi:MAG: hypothetical protein MUF38_10145 [Anaerolineae bacterium]|jgi:hypothetical protein|nr:hypothetical protein [Anaerolineae bacterium]